MKAHPQLKKFMSAYDPNIQDIALYLRNFILENVPESNELIWDNYNALAIAYSKSEDLSDAFCHIALYSKHVNFGFNRGAELSTSAIKLNGSGKLIRHIKVPEIASFPAKEVSKLLLEALGISEARNESLLNVKGEGISKVMSISERKRRP